MNLPDAVVIELTSRCNHRCIFCYCPWENDKNYHNHELSTAEWCQALDLYARHGVRHVTFSGGEPLMRDDLLGLVAHANDLGMTVGIISNGRKIDDKFLQRLLPHNVLLSISVPGIQTYQAHTGVDGIEHTLAIFDKCKAIGIETAANITVTKKNLPELYANISYPILHGANYILLNRFLPGGRGMFHQEYLLDNNELNQMLDTAEEVLSISGIPGHLGTELPYCVIKDPKKYHHFQVSSKCAAAKSFFVTDPSGYIKVCNHSPERLCKWSEIDFLTENRTWQRFQHSDYLPELCHGCEHQNLCDGGCREAAHVNYGDIDDIDPCLACLQNDAKLNHV